MPPPPPPPQILVIDYVHQYLITCGTLYQGVCEKRHVSNISAVEYVDYDNFVVNIVHDGTSSTVAFIAPGPASNATQPNVLYVACTYLEHRFAQIPALASRKLSDFSVAITDLNFYQYSYLRFDSSQQNVFLVHYVYGFGTKGYSYVLARQPKGDRNEAYNSVLIRVCQNDKIYKSYTEVPLVCRHNGTEYNLLQAAVYGHPGRQLATSMGVDMKVDVLYTVFSVGAQQPTSRSAVCVFLLDSIGQVITQSWKACFQGKGNYRGGHLGKSQQCKVNTVRSADSS